MMHKICRDYETTASFDVDAQNGFTPLCNELPVEDGHNIVDALNRQAMCAKFRVGSKDWHPQNALWIATKENPQFSPITGHANMDIRWNAHCIAGTFGAELIKGLPPPEQYDYMVYKGLEPNIHPYGACFHDLAGRKSTGVIEFLKEKRVQTVIVAGLATDYCLVTTALQLCTRFKEIIVNLAGCRGIAKESTDKAITEMLAAGIKVVDDVVKL